MTDDLESLVVRARDGDRDSLERVVVALQTPIYNLALRMLWHPDDALDATQEILIRVITNLASFRGESRFMTWAYRVAANHLLTARRSRVERQRYTFAAFAQELNESSSGAPIQTDEWPPDQAMLLEEVKVGCMHGLLSCLSRPERLVYVLAEIFELDGVEGARILEISPDAFRQRLARARRAIVEFMRVHCGLVEPANACRCIRRLPHSIEKGRVDADKPLFASRETAARFPAILEKVRRLDAERRAAALYRATPTADPGPELLAAIERALDAS